MFRDIASWLAPIYPVFSLNLRNADNYAIKVQGNYIFLHYEQNHCYFNFYIFSLQIYRTRRALRENKNTLYSS